MGPSLPKYKCHKEVWALKIANIVEFEDNGAKITPQEAEYGAFKVDSNYVKKHKPAIGGYYVVYKDGYESYSPADAFENGYSRIYD